MNENGTTTKEQNKKNCRSEKLCSRLDGACVSNVSSFLFYFKWKLLSIKSSSDLFDQNLNLSYICSFIYVPTVDGLKSKIGIRCTDNRHCGQNERIRACAFWYSQNFIVVSTYLYSVKTLLAITRVAQYEYEYV